MWTEEDERLNRRTSRTGRNQSADRLYRTWKRRYMRSYNMKLAQKNQIIKYYEILENNMFYAIICYPIIPLTYFLFKLLYFIVKISSR